MSRPPTVTVDVRDMLCAQALAVVARAVTQAPPGCAVDVVVNTPDVRRDVMAWAAERGAAVQELDASTLRVVGGIA